MNGVADQRDGRTWVVIELTRAGEQLKEEGTLAAMLTDALGAPRDFPVFVPAIIYTRGGRRVVIHLMEGYVFVASGLMETAYFALERTCPYVRQVLATPGLSGLRALSVIPEQTVTEMRQKLRDQVATDIVVGMRIRITEGIYARLEGDVLDMEEDEAHVRILLRSLDLIVRVPKVLLDPLDGNVEPVEDFSDAYPDDTDD